MKKIILTVFTVFALTFAASAQEKVLEEVTDNYYAYSEGTMKDATHQQCGGCHQEYGEGPQERDTDCHICHFKN